MGLDADCIHGDIPQQKREKTMRTFKDGKLPILIATDVASRGIDVDDVDCVINYDVPEENEYYIHRIGRTGRAKKKGIAVSILGTFPEQAKLAEIAKYSHYVVQPVKFAEDGALVEEEPPKPKKAPPRRLPGEEKPLSLPQFQELGRRVRALGCRGDDPLRELTARDLARLGYDAAQSARITRLLAREAQLEQYLRAAAAQGITAVTRLSSQYPARLRHTLGPRCPAVLFAKGEAELLSARCISVVGSRELSGEGRAFAAEAGRRIAAEGFALCSGGAAGADRAAQDACLAHGGSAVIFPAGRLTDCPAQEHVLYLAEQAYDAPFSTPRALGRNYLIHAMGEKTLVAQCRAGSGGTWDGTTENLKHGWSPVFVHDDGTPGAGALIERGAAAVRTLGRLDELQPEQLHF